MELAVEIFYFCSIFLVGLILRAIPHIRYYYPGTPDTFFFLNKIKNPDYESYMPEIALYPKLYIQFLTFLAAGGKLQDGRLMNRLSIIVDTITAFFVYVFVRVGFGSEIALLSTFLILITPYVVKNGSTISVRSFGLLLTSTSILCLSFPLPWKWIASIPIAMTLLSHKLSTQTLLAVSIALTLFDLSVGLIFIIGFILAVISSKGDYIAIFRAHISLVKKFMRGAKYPNKKLIGIIFTPTSFGFLVYFALLILQLFSPASLSIWGIDIPPPLSIDADFEFLMIIWGLVCIILLVIWIAGESYKHLTFAAVPFAFFTSLLAFTHQGFLILVIILTLASLGQSLYFQVRFQYIDKNLVELLKHSSLVDNHSTMFAPSKVARAVSFFTDCEIVSVNLHLYNQEHFDKRFQEYNPTLAVEEKKYGYWYAEWDEVESFGDWMLFRLK